MLLCIDAFVIGSRHSSNRFPSSTTSKLHLSFANVFSPQSTNNVDNGNENKNNDDKLKLLNLLSQVSPNESTSKQLTKEILQAASILENQCPTVDENVLERLVGNWELIWTAQDKSSLDNEDSVDGGIWRRLNPFATFINPCKYVHDVAVCYILSLTYAHHYHISWPPHTRHTYIQWKINPIQTIQ